MNRLTHVSVGALATLAVALPATASTSAAPTDARAANSWTTIHRIVGAKGQACKVSANGGASWKIYNRVDGRNATGRSQAQMWVTRNGVDTPRTWSSGWVRRGTVSAVGSVMVPRAPGYAIQHGIGTDQMGTGGQVSAATIGRC